MIILGVIINNHRNSSSRRKYNIFYVFKVLIKNLKTQLTSQNVALWDINIAFWAIYLFIVTRIFHLWKMTYLTFNWHYSATSWNFLMRFSAKRFALAALSEYYSYIEIVKTLSFDLWYRGISTVYCPQFSSAFKKDILKVQKERKR